jgi:hypothetical protein
MLYNLEQLPTRLRVKIKVIGDCWIWTGSHVREYGQAWWGDRKYLTHKTTARCNAAGLISSAGPRRKFTKS